MTVTVETVDLVVRENDLYCIKIGVSSMHQLENEVQCYKLINKETGLVETETTILPQAIEWMNDFTRLLKSPESRDYMDELSVPIADGIKQIQ